MAKELRALNDALTSIGVSISPPGVLVTGGKIMFCISILIGASIVSLKHHHDDLWFVASDATKSSLWK